MDTAPEVYAYTKFGVTLASGRYDHRQYRVIMATTSKDDFAKALNLKSAELNYVTKTRDIVEVALATTSPGALFGCPNHDIKEQLFIELPLVR